MPSSEDGQEDGQFTSFLSYMLEDLPCHKLNLGSKKSEGRDKLNKFEISGCSSFIPFFLKRNI